MNIQISNLHLNVLDRDIRRIFHPFGEVRSITMMRDKLSNRLTGRAFVEMPVELQGQQAIQSLHRSLLYGKPISVVAVESMEDIANRLSNF